MPLSNVNIDIINGGLGLQPGTGTGVICKVGVSSAGDVNQIVSITDKDQIRGLLGTGTLANAIADSLMGGAEVVYAVRAAGDIAGSVSAVTAEKTGTGSMTVAGAPLDAYRAVIEITDTGTLNQAVFKLSLDGGATFAPRATVPSAGSYPIAGTGLTLAFAQGAQDLPNSFKKGDRYTFAAAAPAASVASVNAALDVLLDTNLTYEGIHVVGESGQPAWVALDARAREAEGRFRYIYILAEAAKPAAGETVDEYVAARLAEAETFASDRVGVCAAFAKVADSLTGLVAERNLMGVLAGRLSAMKVQESLGKVALGGLPGIVELLPANLNDGHIFALDGAGYITARRYEGLNGFYATEFRLMAEDTSDYQFGEYRRVMDKACKLVRVAGLKFKNAEATEEGLAALTAYLQQPLNIMQGDREIEKGSIAIPPNQDILATSRLKVKVSIVPIGIMRNIDIEIGLTNPFVLGGELK
jgi:hypothetical protein